jgi:hypothetical protein
MHLSRGMHRLGDNLDDWIPEQPQRMTAIAMFDRKIESKYANTACKAWEDVLHWVWPVHGQSMHKEGTQEQTLN